MVEGAAPGTLTDGSGGNGSPQHIAMAPFANRAGLHSSHVPYKGGVAAGAGDRAGGTVRAVRQADP